VREKPNIREDAIVREKLSTNKIRIIQTGGEVVSVKLSRKTN